MVGFRAALFWGSPMAKKFFAALDTCVLVSVVTQGQEGFDFEHWIELAKLVESSRVTLLVPETVILEFEKRSRSPVV